MYACLAVTCHLHFWQNDRDFLRATVVTRGWNGYRNKSQHRKSTLEKKNLPPFQQGFEPATFQSRVRCSNHWAIPAPRSLSNESAFIFLPWALIVFLCSLLPSFFEQRECFCTPPLSIESVSVLPPSFLLWATRVLLYSSLEHRKCFCASSFLPSLSNESASVLLPWA